MLMGLTVPKLLLILAIGLLVFGPGKLSQVGKSLGEGIRAFRSGATEKPEEETQVAAATETKDAK